MNRFFEAASGVLIGRDAMVDKFVGDEVIGIFLPVMTGPTHARHAVDAGRDLLAATGSDTDQPWLPIGIGVNTGVSYVGTVGEGDNVDITAMGDPGKRRCQTGRCRRRGRDARHSPSGGCGRAR